MSTTLHKLVCLAGTAAASLTTGTAQAAPLPEPSGCTDFRTAAERVVSGRTVQVRYGMCNGARHAWGRILGYTPGDYIRFEVDTNGDRIPDGVSWYLATNRNYTQPTPTGPSRAFRSCWVRGGATCNHSNSTPWVTDMLQMQQ